MSEWSPGGNYSCPGTPNQTGRSKSTLSELQKGTKCTTGKVQAVLENKKKSFQQHSIEDIPEPSSHLTTKKVKVPGSHISDPRFKRVLPSGGQNDACVGTDVNSSKPSLVSQEKCSPFAKISLRNIKEFKPNQKNLSSPSEQKVNQPDHVGKQCSEKLIAPEDPTLDPLKAVDNLSFNHDLVVNSLLKESLSACTVNTRNTSLASEEFVDELSNELKREASATRIKNVQNWIQSQTPKIEKKHSVVTVIGQMQGPDTLSSAFREIDKRRKLVKELDRYAVCKKITESDNETENYDLITNVGCMATADKVLFPDSDEILITSLPKTDGDNLRKKKSDLPNNENNDMNNDSTIPLSVSRRSSSIKNKLNKSQVNSESVIKGISKGKFRLFLSGVYYQRILCVLVLIGGILCWFAFFSVQATRVSFDLFTPKPKPLSWHEKVLQWIWELFRPSANYQRSTPWRN